MAEVIWGGGALRDLEAIAHYIALDKPDAAGRLVGKIFGRTDLLSAFPETGSFIPELRPSLLFRQVIVPPCRIFYRFHSATGIVRILGVMRGEQLFRAALLITRDSEDS